ncbi:MAG: hypothetical protein QNJ72_21245 [Pleurocapsa sp. MO_226.B13]|nr:hypothetical protein [Pleurocapsa sp. MO_226.B13]
MVDINVALRSPLNRYNLVQFSGGTDNLVIIEGDRFIRQQEQDFRPHLPLILRW